ncbi:MAG: type I restriction endonuclease [Candidatus Binatia bacterium]
MGLRGTESEFELTTIERLEQLDYDYIHGSEIDRNLEQVVLHDRLDSQLALRYPDLPKNSLEEAVRRFSRPDGIDTLRRNMNFHDALTRGIELKVEQPDERIEHRHIYAIDWENPDNNDFLAVNQFSIKGKNKRRPDIIIFVNGLTLVVFELKNPFVKSATVDHALNQIAHYRNDIPQLFDFNALTVVSDEVTTLHGMWTASREWFSPWKSIDGLHVAAGTTDAHRGPLPQGSSPQLHPPLHRLRCDPGKNLQEGGQVPPVLCSPTGCPESH